MTPKEKADELLNNYRTIIRKADIYGNLDSKDEIYLAKQCALIAVDELLRRCWDYRDIDLGSSYDYWQEVKQEIEKL